MKILGSVPYDRVKAIKRASRTKEIPCQQIIENKKKKVKKLNNKELFDLYLKEEMADGQ